MRLILTAIIILISNICIGQNKSSSESLEFYLLELTNKHEDYYQEVLDIYKNRIEANPEDVSIVIEKCEFLERSKYNKDEGYSFNWQLVDSCRSELIKIFPNEPEALIYFYTNKYSEDSENELLDLLSKDIVRDHPEVWKVYQRLAEHYQFNSPSESLDFALKAEKANDTLQLDWLVINGSFESGDEDRAIYRIQRIYDNDPNSINNSHAQIALDLQDLDLAIQLYDQILKDSTQFIDYSNLAKTYLDLGELQLAKRFLLKSHKVSYQKAIPSYELFEYELKHGSCDSLAMSYDRIRSLGWESDLFGIDYLRMVFQRFCFGNKWYYVLTPFSLIFVFLVLVVLPYLWILPVDFIGRLRSSKGFAFRGFSFPFGLKYFWIISVIYLLTDFMSSLFFDYHNYIAEFFFDYYSEWELNELELAQMTLFIAIIEAILLTILLRYHHWKAFVGEKNRILKNILIGFAGLIVFKIVFAFWIVVFDLNQEVLGMLASVREDIIAVNSEYGLISCLFLTVGLAPIFEELVFRGIILSSCEKKIGFIYANIFQSLIFATLHWSAEWFIFYFFFSIVAAWLRNKTKSLIAPVSFHALNNLIATLTMVS